MNNIIHEEYEVEFRDYSQLSYNDLDAEEVQLFVDDKLIGLIEVYTDKENGNREYVCINYEIVYLDTIKNRV